jgi:hypothetical protein
MKQLFSIIIKAIIALAIAEAIFPKDLGAQSLFAVILIFLFTFIQGAYQAREINVKRIK